MGLILVLLLVVFVIERNKIVGDMSFFQPITQECNRAFPVKSEAALPANISKFMELKNDRNAKCFIHCVFHKLNFVDGTGKIKREELFENANKVWAEIPDNKRGTINIPTITPKLKELASSLLDICEAQESIVQESDPCDKLYNFASCLIEDLANPGA